MSIYHRFAIVQFLVENPPVAVRRDSDPLHVATINGHYLMPCFPFGGYVETGMETPGPRISEIRGDNPSQFHRPDVILGRKGIYQRKSRCKNKGVEFHRLIVLKGQFRQRAEGVSMKLSIIYFAGI